ncbi:uncharacterized protein [Euphorbia lathyris]|uniref:uncharacterized protein n=1 Tax=Euphorbia lathyris TaxID=212925 RepID=UPI0033137CF1
MSSISVPSPLLSSFLSFPKKNSLLQFHSLDLPGFPHLHQFVLIPRSPSSPVLFFRYEAIEVVSSIFFSSSSVLLAKVWGSICLISSSACILWILQTRIQHPLPVTGTSYGGSLWNQIQRGWTFGNIRFDEETDSSEYTNCSNEEKPPIFVELGETGYKLFRLDYVWVSKPDDPEITFGCGFRPPEKEYPHPIATDADHYHTAQIAYPCPESTKQQELAKLFQPKGKNHQKYGKVVGRIRTVYDFKELDHQCSFSPEVSDHEYAEHTLKCINMKETPWV